MNNPRDPVDSPRVVVIDDEPNLLASLTELLADCGITVVATATDGCQALPVLVNAIDKYGHIDALILDERMPHTSGLEAARLIRRFYPNLPVILYTAYAGMLGDAPRVAGVTAQISKGEHPSTLVTTIRTAAGAAMTPA